MRLLKFTVMSLAVLAASAAASADKTTQEMRDVAAFTKVKLKGSMDVEVKVGPKQSLKVIADSDIINYLSTDVTDTMLEIDMKHNKGLRGLFGNHGRTSVIITVPNLEAAELSGSGDLLIEDVNQDQFDLGLRGSGDIVMKNAQTSHIDIELRGSGDIKINGRCDRVKISLQGSGDIMAKKMACKTADVMVQGSGDVSVFASENADVTVRGSGDIYVSGKPNILNQRVKGSGDIYIR